MRGWQVAMRVHLKGIHSVRSKGCVYHYAWRGGPRIKAEPGSPAFMREYQEAHAARQRPPENCLFTLIVEFKQSAEFGGLSARARATTSRSFGRSRPTSGRCRFERQRIRGREACSSRGGMDFPTAPARLITFGPCFPGPFFWKGSRQADDERLRAGREVV